MAGVGGVTLSIIVERHSSDIKRVHMEVEIGVSRSIID